MFRKLANFEKLRGYLPLLKLRCGFLVETRLERLFKSPAAAFHHQPPGAKTATVEPPHRTAALIFVKHVVHNRFTTVSIPPCILMSNNSFWSDACNYAKDKPLQTLLRVAYASCGVTVR